VATITSWEEDRSYTGPLSRCAVMRRNTLHNNAAFWIGGVPHDVFAEKCVVMNNDTAINIEREPRYVLLRNDVFKKVEKTVCGDGASKALVLPHEN
jgi:hypothetical protein